MRRNLALRSRRFGHGGVQYGFSLIELMVALTIGFAVVGALFAAYIVAAQSGRSSQAVIQMAEDASQALNLMRSQVAMAGYGEPIAAEELSFKTRYTASPLFGCDGASFVDATAPMDDLACATAPEAVAARMRADSLAVGYQVSVSAVAGRALANSAVSADAQPYDCIGNTLQAEAGIYRADSHYYLATPSGAVHPALYCAQGGAAVGGQPLVENIADLQVRYLLASDSHNKQITYFSNAPSALPGAGSAWSNVNAVRICIEMVSATKFSNSMGSNNYLDCADKPHQATDGYLHRVFTTTVWLQNKS